MGGSARDLRAAGPLSMIDRAVALTRGSIAEVALPAWSGGGLLASVLLGIYYLERVEGIHTLRLPLALLLVLAFGGRSVLVARAAGRVTERLWDTRPDPAAGRTASVLRTAMVVALGLWVWSWLLVAGSLAGIVGVLPVLPLFIVRGAVAPSWLARAVREPEAGWGAFGRAFGDAQGRRFEGLLVEGMVLAAALGLMVNVYALLVVSLVLSRSLVGLELASIETFLSPNNTFVILCVAAVALVALEPLRAALSAQAYVDARVRAEGLDLRAAVEEAIEHAERRGPPDRAAGAKAAVVMLALSLGAAPALAQPPPAFPPPPMDGYEAEAPLDADILPDAERRTSTVGDIPAPSPSPDDLAAEERARAILERSEFRELADHRGEGLRDLIERLFEWLLRPRDDLPQVDAPDLPSFALPGAWFFIALGALLLIGVGVYLWLTRQRERKAAKAAEAAITTDPRDRPPAAFLDDAARLADAGDLREALRSLYLATLVALDRRRLIAFDPHRTNWQYLRQMPRGAERDAFAAFTRLFDHKWYGRELTTAEDYARCRALAREIVGDARAEAA